MQAIKQFRLRELAPLIKVDLTKSTAPKIPNPFLPHKNPDSGRWAPPKYSLRRQAQLIKHARQSNTIYLLPPGPKLSTKELSGISVASSAPSSMKKEIWEQKVDWQGEVKEKEVPGTDIGSTLYAGKRRMFKGHKWERTQKKREETRKLMMQGMKQRIERFKGTYGRKRPSPISVPRNTSYSKLPF